ncbi:MAG: hypothetical protein WA843_05010, partial [Candidatus Saccharimonadales bacterium]
MDIEQKRLTKAAELSFARGNVGHQERLIGELAEDRFMLALGGHTAEITKLNTADCGDDRRTLRLADGTNDPQELRQRIVPQLFGGLGLATTKALVAANAVLVRDAKTMWGAYEKTSQTLLELGQEDGGHENCGASMSVESSVANALQLPTLTGAVKLFLPVDEGVEALLRRNSQNKQHRLADGFYSDWDPQKHIDYLVSRF